MASLREAARSIYDDAKAGISWIAIWKTGRSWNAETMYDTEYEEANKWRHTPSTWKVSEDDAKRLMEIHGEDSEAILVNPYYCNLGPWEEMTLETLIDGIKFQYSFGGDVMDILHQAGRA